MAARAEASELSPTRRRIVLATRLVLVGTWLATAVITHLPGPSGSSDPARASQIRAVWQAFGRFARALASPFTGLRDGSSSVGALFDDKAIHFALTLMLAFAWSLSRAVAGRLPRRHATVIAVALIGYAGVSELLQTVIGRIADPGDFFAAALGAVVGTGAIYLARRSLGPEGVSG